MRMCNTRPCIASLARCRPPLQWEGDMEIDEELIEDGSPNSWSAASMVNPNADHQVDHQD